MFAACKACAGGHQTGSTVVGGSRVPGIFTRAWQCEFMRKITIIDGHPDADRAHVVHALADRYAETAIAQGHEVRSVNVAQLDFPLLRLPSEFEHGPAPAGVLQAQQDIKWADHLVLFFPLWHGMVPAYFKAFIEQTFRPGYAMAENPKGFPKPLLAGKSARIIVTMGMPALIYRFYFGGHGVKALERSILSFAGVRPIHTTLIGGVGEGAANAAKWFKRIECLVRRDGKRRRAEPLRRATVAPT